ncbi:Uncharacterised protein [Enterobacter ludwigii]|nr:Uncharacterised protein [Enterobacter ludwigii]
MKLCQLFGKTAFLLLIEALLQRPGGEWQAAWGFPDAQIHAPGSKRGQEVEIFCDFVRAVVLEHDATRAHADTPGLPEDPGD